MHEESSYEGLDLIECEVRRRTFWLLFDGKFNYCSRDTRPSTAFRRTHECGNDLADKSMSILLGRPISLRDEDTTCNFPRELDDE